MMKKYINNYHIHPTEIRHFMETIIRHDYVDCFKFFLEKIGIYLKVSNIDRIIKWNSNDILCYVCETEAAAVISKDQFDQIIKMRKINAIIILFENKYFNLKVKIESLIIVAEKHDHELLYLLLKNVSNEDRMEYLARIKNILPSDFYEKLILDLTNNLIGTTVSSEIQITTEKPVEKTTIVAYDPVEINSTATNSDKSLSAELSDNPNFNDINIENIIDVNKLKINCCPNLTSIGLEKLISVTDLQITNMKLDSTLFLARMLKLVSLKVVNCEFPKHWLANITVPGIIDHQYFIERGIPIENVLPLRWRNKMKHVSITGCTIDGQDLFYLCNTDVVELHNVTFNNMAPKSWKYLSNVKSLVLDSINITNEDLQYLEGVEFITFYKCKNINLAGLRHLIERNCRFNTIECDISTFDIY